MNMATVFAVDVNEISSIDRWAISSQNAQKIAKVVVEKDLDVMPALEGQNNITKLTQTKSKKVHPKRNDPKSGNENLDLLEDEKIEKKRNKIFIVPEYQSDQNEDNSLWSLKSEKERAEEKARKRTKKFKAIILNEPIDFSWINLLVNSLKIIVSGLLTTIPLTIILYRDVIEFPEFWYEILIPGPIVLAFSSVYVCIRLGSFMNIEYLFLAKMVATMFFIGFTTLFFLVVPGYYLWTSILKYQYPIPFLGFVAIYFSLTYSTSIIWFLFPKPWRRNKLFRKRMGFMALFTVLQLTFTILGYNIIVRILGKSSSQYRPMVALALPAFREINDRIFSKLIRKVSHGDTPGSMILLKCLVNVQYATILCVILGSIATSATSWILIGVDYAYNMYLCFKIVRTKNRSPQTIQSKIDTLQELAITEIVEFVAPLGFILVFVAAAYGPNVKLFGNIGSSYWAYREIDDINQGIENMVYLFLVDFSSVVVTAFILRIKCKINLWKAFHELQKEFVNIASVFFEYQITIVCIIFIF